MKAFWYKKRNNFGDLIAPLLIEALSGEPADCCEDSGGRIITVGSLLHFLRPNDIVWGTGSLEPIESIDPSVQVYATRGPKTRQQFLRCGINAPPVYGDPALLLPYLYNIHTTEEYAACIVPHYYDESLIVRNRISSCPIVDIRSGIEEVISGIAKARVVLSSALHGLILAESLGKRAIRVVFQEWEGKGRRAGTWKFEDYYLGTGRKLQPSIDWREQSIDDEAIRRAIESANAIEPLSDQKRETTCRDLIRSCPFNRRMTRLTRLDLPLASV